MLDPLTRQIICDHCKHEIRPKQAKLSAKGKDFHWAKAYLSCRKAGAKYL